MISPRHLGGTEASSADSLQRVGLFFDRASSGPQFVWHKEQGLATIASTRHSLLAEGSAGNLARRSHSIGTGRHAADGLTEDSDESADGSVPSPHKRLAGQRTRGSLPAVTERNSAREQEDAPAAASEAAAAAAAAAAAEVVQRRRAEKAETEALRLREQMATLRKQGSSEEGGAAAGACTSPRCSITVTPRQGPEQRLVELNLQIARLTEEAKQLSMMIAPPPPPPRSGESRRGLATLATLAPLERETRSPKSPRSPLKSAERRSESAGLDDPKLSALLQDARRQAAQRRSSPMGSPEPPPAQRIRLELRRAPVTRGYGLAIRSTVGQAHVVAEVDPDGQADVAGVRVGDVVEAIGGHLMIDGETPVPYLPPRSSDAAVELVLRRPPPPPESAMSTPPRKSQSRCRVSPGPDVAAQAQENDERGSPSPSLGADPPEVPPRRKHSRESIASRNAAAGPPAEPPAPADPEQPTEQPAEQQSRPDAPFMAKVSTFFGKSMEMVGSILAPPNASAAPLGAAPSAAAAAATDGGGGVETADAVRASSLPTPRFPAPPRSLALGQRMSGETPTSSPVLFAGGEAASQLSLDEQESRRRAWIAFHLASGDEDEARALGWDSEEAELTTLSGVTRVKAAKPADGAPIPVRPIPVRAARPRKLSDGFGSEDAFVAEPSPSKLGVTREKSCTDASLGQTEAMQAAAADMAQAEAAEPAASLAAVADAEASRIWQVAMAVTEAKAERSQVGGKNADAEARAEQARAALATEARAEAAELLHLSGASVPGTGASASAAPAPAPAAAAGGGDDDDDWDTEADFVAEMQAPGSNSDPGAEERAARGAADRGRALLGAAGLDDDEVAAAPPSRYVGLQNRRQSTDAALYEAIAEANAAAMGATALASAADEAGARATTALNAATKCADTAPTAPPSAPGSRQSSLQRLPLASKSSKRLVAPPPGSPPGMGTLGSSRALNGGASAAKDERPAAPSRAALSSADLSSERQGSSVVTLDQVAATNYTIAPERSKAKAVSAVTPEMLAKLQQAKADLAEQEAKRKQ